MVTFATDISQQCQWNARRANRNQVLLTCLQSGGSAFNLSTYTFTFKVWVYGAESSPVISLSQGSGITNSGAAGTLLLDITEAQSTLTPNIYLMKLEATYPDSTIRTWINGSWVLKGDLYDGGGATSVTISLNATGTPVTITLNSAVGSGGGTPGGSTTQIQFNNAGAFGGFGSWNGTTFAIGTLGYSDTGINASFQSSTNSFNQVILQNTNAGAAASTNFNVSNDAGTATTNFGEFGINSSGFTGTGSFSQAGYVYLASASTDLVIGTYANKSIRFVVNSGATDAITISGAGAFTFNGSGTAIWKSIFNGLGTTPVEGAGHWLANTTAAALGAQQISPSTTWEGQGWATGVNNSQSVKYMVDVLPVQAATNPVGNWRIKGSINGTSYNELVNVYYNTSLLGSKVQVLIGPTTASLPNAVLQIGDQAAATYPANDIGVLVSRTINASTGSGDAHGYGDVSTVTRSTASYNSFDARTNFGSSWSYGHYAAFQSRPTFAVGSPGVTGQIYGFYHAPAVGGGFTLTSMYGGYVEDTIPTGGSIITTQYGFYVNTLTGGATNYAFYSNGTTPSVFGGVHTTGGNIINQNGSNATSNATQGSSYELSLKNSLWTGSAETKGWYTWRVEPSVHSQPLNHTLKLYESSGATPGFSNVIFRLEAYDAQDAVGNYILGRASTNNNFRLNITSGDSYIGFQNASDAPLSGLKYTGSTGVLTIDNAGGGGGTQFLGGNVNIGSGLNNAKLYIQQSALVSTWIPALRVDPGAHTSLTAATAFPNHVFSSATKTWVAVAGTIAAQKDTEFRAITHSAATSGTITDLYNSYFEDPLVSVNMTATRKWSIGAQGSLNVEKNIVIGTAALATNATDGFFHLSSSAGAPTGTPTAYTGRVPIHVDTTNNFLYLYIGGAWKKSTVYA